jgi:hypothetical protein
MYLILDKVFILWYIKYNNKDKIVLNKGNIMKNETYNLSLRLPIDIKDNLKRVSKQTGQSINTILSNSTKSIIKTKLGVISCLKK